MPSVRSRLAPPAHFLLPGAGLLLTGCLGNPFQAPGPLPVSVQPAASYPFARAIATISTLEAPEEMVLGAEAGGRVASLRIRPGDRVRQGQLLVVLDQSELQEEVKALRSQRDQSRLTVQRIAFLSQQGAISAIQRDAVQQSHRALEAELKALQEDLAHKDLRSPVDGVVSDVAVRTGDVIEVGTSFTTLQNSQRLLARMELPARDGQRLKPGQLVLFAPSPGRPAHRGRVLSLETRGGKGSRAVVVKAELTNPSGGLRTGQRLGSRVVLDSSPQLAVPAQAVSRANGQTYVFVIGTLTDLEQLPGSAPLGQLRRLPPTSRFALQRSVRLGPLQNDHYPVLGGLEAGQTLIVSNPANLRHGTPVTPQ